jgi:hypothetical protein
MANSKNFAPQFLQKPASERSLTDPVPEPELEADPNTPTAEVMIDALYGIMMKRFDAIEELLKKEECKCQKK